MLNWMKKGFPMFAALAAGYIGGALNTLINQGRPAATIRAYRFEVAGESGRTVAVWGREPSGAQASDSGTALVFNDQRGGRRLEMGTNAGNNAPFLRLFGEEGGERAGLTLGFNSDPTLTLRDQHKIRVMLGATHSDAPSTLEDQWGLRIRARKEGAGASIGFYRWWDDSYHPAVTLSNGAGQVWEAAAGPAPNPTPLHKN